MWMAITATSIVFMPLTLLTMIIIHMFTFDVERFRKKPYQFDFRQME